MTRLGLVDELLAGGTSAVILIDLDGFRSINEVFGYAVGDMVLQECARRLDRILPPGTSLARLGDDEFAIAVSDDVDLVTLAEEAAEAIRVPFMIGGHSHTITASIGIAAGVDGLESGDLLQAADGALEQAKERGGDRLELFDPVLLERTRRRATIEQEMRRGLRARQFLLHYQPQVSMATGLISGVEALVRWQHPVNGIVHPGAFIPVAEESGLIRELGALVLRQACQDAVVLLERRDREGRFTVSVNVSTVQMQDASFVRTVADALEHTQLDPAVLCLEITESAVLGTSLRLESVLGQLRDLGVRFSIDDFGTGYSSLSNLRRLPVDELKIDRSFIVAMDEPQGRRMVAAVCGIAKALELEVVAEGVDDDAAIAPLRSWGCDIVQGFLYFKPQPLDRVLRALRKDRPRRLPDRV